MVLVMSAQASAQIVALSRATFLCPVVGARQPQRDSRVGPTQAKSAPGPC